MNDALTTLVEIASAKNAAGHMITADLVYGKLGTVQAVIRVWQKMSSRFVADTSMAWCPANGCMSLFSLIPDDLTEEDRDAVDKAQKTGGVVSKELSDKLVAGVNRVFFCQRCNKPVNGEELCLESRYNVTRGALANKLEEIWANLGGVADFHVRVHPQDYIASYKKADAVLTANNALEDGRADIRHVYYHNADVVRDVAAGGSVSSKLSAMLYG